MAITDGTVCALVQCMLPLTGNPAPHQITTALRTPVLTHDIGNIRRSSLRSAVSWAAGGAGLIALGYAGLVATAWLRYGHVSPGAADETDDLLDRFMPRYEVVERHHVRVSAPAAITLSAAKDGDLNRSAFIRGIFKAREIVLGADGAESVRQGLIARMTSLGWCILAETADREIVLGAVTQPWMPNVVFRGIPPAEFRAFREPGYVKIVWNLRADPLGDAHSMFRTETRVSTTDDAARVKFRWYWARFSPGIALIRRAMLPAVKKDAEARVPGAVSQGLTPAGDRSS